MFNHYSHGKLLITGEYLVLKGATALASPVKFGQSITLQATTDNDNILWRSYEHKRLWFEGHFDVNKFKFVENTNSQIAEQLLMILKSIEQLNPGKIKGYCGQEILNQSNFDLNWGLGSSSSLLVNLAKLFEINPFSLHDKVSNGSAYDIACAEAQSALLFTRKDHERKIEAVNFHPPFKDQLYFIYLGKKQNSFRSVEHFLKRKKRFKNEIGWITELSHHIANVEKLDNFNYYLHEHEMIISSILKEKPIKKNHFNDFEGFIKSLGAWGGDFCLVSWEGERKYLEDYFHSKGLATILSFKDMIL